MNVEFFWTENCSRKEPYLTTSVKDDDGFYLLACLLSDDDRMGCKQAMGDIDKGIHGINLIKESKQKIFDWARHGWGALLGPKEAKIYSLYDEDYFVVMDFNDVDTMLKGWRKLILEE